jgi:hypothetical protein
MMERPPPGDAVDAEVAGSGSCVSPESEADPDA